jgi:glycosyltransferase involved in cell wall biosynthesis
MSEVPSITVVIAYHNEPEDFVRECLDSLLSQTFGSWEGIVVDDGSSQETISAVIEELCDPRFKVIHHAENRGLGAARNTGIRAAKALLVALLDADDRLDPLFLEETYGALRDRPEADWVVVDWKVFGTSDEVWPFPIDESLNCPAHFLFVGSGALMRRSVWESIGGYPEDEALRGGEDWDFWIGAAERALQPIHLARPLYQYRTHPEAMTFSTARYANHRFRKAIYRRHQTAFESMGLDCPRCPSPRARVARFLAQGLAVSSGAFLDRGERARAIGLAVNAFLLQPRNASFRRHLLRSLLPRGLRAHVGRLLRRRRDADSGAGIKDTPVPKIPDG